MIEYLIARKRHDQERPPAENYSFEHVCGREKKHRLGGASGASPWMVTLALRYPSAVLSYQRRIHAVKHWFFKRGKRTPLGRTVQ